MPNKKSKFIALGLVSLFGLTACGNEVVAKPTGYDKDTIAQIDGYDEEIYNNLLSVIYDEIRDGSLGSDVLNKVLYQYAISIFGAYDNKVTGYVEGTTTLEDAFKGITPNADETSFTATQKTKNFIRDHKAYWTYDNDGKHVDGETEITVKEDEDYNATQSEIARVYAKWKNVEKRIAQKMYSNISGGAYSDRNLFYESRYLMSLRGAMKKVSLPAEGVHDGVLLSPDVEDYDVFDTTKGFLKREFYQGGDYAYIEEDIVPSIYNEMLVEQYILDEQYNTLGRSYAREVEVVSIKANDSYPLAARYLVNEFVEKYISGPNAKPNATTVAGATNGVTLDTLKILSNAWKGVDLTTEEEALVVDSEGFILKDVDGEEVYLGTEYGDMIEDYSKIKADLFDTDSGVESSFTSSGKYSKEVGKLLKMREIDLKDHTENGWYIKEGGMSSLPSSIVDRLFNVAVANALTEGSDAEVAAQDRWQYSNGEWSYVKPEGETSRYVSLINGTYFLKAPDAENIERDMLHYDSSTKTYYIVVIKEASSTSKLSKVNDNRYAKTRGDKVMEDIVNEICEKVAKKDTYKTLSTKHWLEDALLKYHDQKVYDYFKSNYPELFEQPILLIIH